MDPKVVIRPAEPRDVVSIHGLILELAEYEKLHEVNAEKDDLHRALFEGSPAAEALVVERVGEIIAFALFFHTYSTFEGRRGLYLEDLCKSSTVVLVFRLAVERDCARFEWSALDWNEPALRVYRGIGAKSMDEWQTFRLEGKAQEFEVIK